MNYNEEIQNFLSQIVTIATSQEINEKEKIKALEELEETIETTIHENDWPLQTIEKLQFSIMDLGYELIKKDVSRNIINYVTTNIARGKLETIWRQTLVKEFKGRMPCRF